MIANSPTAAASTGEFDDRLLDDDAAASPVGSMPLPWHGDAAGERPGGDEQEVHFWFPVTVEIIGAPDAELADRIVARVFDELNRELDSRS